MRQRSTSNHNVQLNIKIQGNNKYKGIINTVPTLDHCALIIFFGAMETCNEYFATLEIGVRNRVRKREIIPVRAGAQLCAITKLINVINSRQWIVRACHPAGEAGGRCCARAAAFQGCNPGCKR